MKPLALSLIAAAACLHTASAAPLFSTEDIFPPQDKHAHGSSIVQLPGGDFIACWFQGSGERSADDVLVQGARLGKDADAWSPVFVMADTPGYPDCNPVLHLDAQERLWLYWIPVLAHRWECSQLKYRWSDDYANDGPPNWTWQDLIYLDPGENMSEVLEKKFKELGMEEGLWGEYAPPYERMLIEAAQDAYKRQTGWMTRIHPLVLPSGRMLLPLYSDGFNVSLIAISDDNGAHWRASELIVGLGPIQPTLVRKKDGSIVAYLRDSGAAPYRVMISTSTDDGETWTIAVDTDIPNPGSSLEAIALDSGEWLMVLNDTEEGRHQLTAMISDDEGASWKWQRKIEPTGDKGHSFSYPSVIQTPDGLIHTTYSYAGSDGKTIRHAAFNAEWVKAGE